MCALMDDAPIETTRRKEHTMKTLFETVRVGRYTLQNRLVMAPMTRSRAEFDGTSGHAGDHPS